MASLRKKPADAVTPDDPAVALILKTSPSPSPTPPNDEAAEALKLQLETLRQAENMQQQAAIATLAATERRKAWLESTPAAKDHLNELNVLHHAALNAGLADCSPNYFDFMESQLADLSAQPPAATHLAKEIEQRAAQNRAPEPPPPSPRLSGAYVSAPVSREVPGSNGRRERNKTTISPLEIEHARVAGISVEEYAKQKLKYEQMRESGMYGERER